MARKEVMTHKSGKFVFSHDYDEAALMPLMIETETIIKVITTLSVPISSGEVLTEDIMRRSIHGTAAVEGNPLSEEQVGNLLKSDQEISSIKADQEIINLKRLYQGMTFNLPKGATIAVDENLVKEIHRIITNNIDYQANEPGVYRNHKVQVGDRGHGGIYNPPKMFKDIQTLMSSFCQWINSDDLRDQPMGVQAALAHYYLGTIHPFGDGNGRTARALEAIILSAERIKMIPILLSNYYYQRQDDYYIAFTATEKTNNLDMTPFLLFFYTSLKDSAIDLLNTMAGILRKFTIRDLYSFLRKNKQITQRQFDFIELLLDGQAKPPSLDDLFAASPFNLLYRDVSEQTARRDLKKLAEMNLLIKNDDKTYSLNFNAIG